MEVRRTLCVLSALAVMGWSVKVLWADPSCTTPARTCAPTCTTPCPPRPICIKVPNHIETTPESEPETAPGAFAAPPRTGVVAGESTSLGIEGGELRIPSLSLRLPSVRLPSFRKYRRDAHMEIDATEAAYVNNFREEFSVDAGRQGNEESLPQPPRRPENLESCTQGAAGESASQQQLEEALEAVRQLKRRLAELEEEKNCPAKCPPKNSLREPPMPQETIPTPVSDPAEYPYSRAPQSAPMYGYQPELRPQVDQRMDRLETMMVMIHEEMRQQRLANAAQSDVRAAQWTDARVAPPSRLPLATHPETMRRLPPAHAYQGE